MNCEALVSSSLLENWSIAIFIWVPTIAL